MTTVTNDTREQAASDRTSAGIVIAVASAISFGLAGALARGPLDAGWSPGAVTLARVGVGALLVLPLGLVVLRGRWHLLRTNAGLVVAYGVLGVAGAQFCYFSAVQHMQVAPALMIEYTAPAAVVVWMWLRHGQSPSWVTLLGAGVAALGLLLVLDVVSGSDVSMVGALWATGAMVGLAGYFVISADEDNGLPPLVLAAGGLVVGSLLLGGLGLVGLLPMRAGSAEPVYEGVAGGWAVPWWLPLIALGLVSAAVAYVTGIEASRRLGSRLASFVGLSEVLAAVVAAWLLLGELPGQVQLAGGVLVLAGVVAVKLGERRVTRLVERPEPTGS